MEDARGLVEMASDDATLRACGASAKLLGSANAGRCGAGEAFRPQVP
jgi:hypothetical protein